MYMLNLLERTHDLPVKNNIDNCLDYKNRLS